MITLDDDPIVGKFIERVIGVRSLSFKSAGRLFSAERTYQPEGVFVDIHLEDQESGLDAVPKLRELWADIPILVITSNVQADTIGDALASGADDFLRKPLSKEELQARFLTRKRQRHQMAMASEKRVGDITIHLVQRRVCGPLGEGYLTPIEMTILTLLVEAEGMTVEHEVLMRSCWGSLSVSKNALERHVHCVRNVLKETSQQCKVKSSYGKGYHFSVDSEKQSKAS